MSYMQERGVGLTLEREQSIYLASLSIFSTAFEEDLLVDQGLFASAIDCFQMQRPNGCLFIRGGGSLEMAQNYSKHLV